VSNPSHDVRAEQSALEVGANARLFATRQIGAELENMRRELVVCGRELQSARPFRGGSFVDDMLRLLARLTCRIAVIGQVKAGKSTFINGLVRSPSLLPTDVNPWTTAVTHLHFARADAPPNIAAEFSFFDSNEWERLARGGGHIRELTQRLVPGFEPELLHKHVDAMRRRSEERLGSTLRTLLGKKHAFPSITTEVLERYVCSGLPSSGTEHKGVYSDVVKSADLYFSSNDFGFPTTIIDTPGTNDPFLVRDEITRRALENADLYIVVLTARQALSSADVALLRILRGLHKERICVFINRIDELGDLAREVPAIVKHVQTGLGREFPSSEIPVVAGAALWAEIAIRGGGPEADRALTPKVRDYAKFLTSSAAPVAPSTPQERIETLFMCSGLSPLCQVLARLTLDSHTGRVLTQISRSFSELARVGQNAASHEVEVLETEGRSVVATGNQGEMELRAVDAEVKENERLTVTLQALLTDLQVRTDQVIEDQCMKMVEILRDVVAGFSEVECENMRNALAEGHRGRVWRSDSTLLRQSLEEELIKSYREAEQEIAKLESHVFPKLKLLLGRYRPDWHDQTTTDGGPAELPPLTALSKAVALDLGEPWWKQWWTRDRNFEGQVAELDGLIRREFYPIVDELGQSARAQLKVRQATSLQEANMVFMGLVELLKEQSRARLERMSALITGGEAARAPDVQRTRDARTAELKGQISKMDQLARRLESIEQAWAERIG
jgi:dynamin family protein